MLVRTLAAACRPSVRRSVQHRRRLIPLISTSSSSSCLRHFANSRALLHASDMERVDTSTRLAKLRELMQKHDFDVYIVPSEDAHASEYIAACDARRAHISGFSGSAGTAVVTLERAALSTDGRYFNQAAQQLDSNWELLKQGLDDVPTWQEWTAERAEGGKAVGVDSTLLPAPEARRLEEKIKKGGGRLVGSTTNLIDEVWGSARPPRPNEKVRVLGLEFAGKPFPEKLAELRKELAKKKCAGLVISMLDEIAWLLNLRGGDIPYNPVFFAYASVTPDAAKLYVDAHKLDDAVHAHLGDAVEVRPYMAIFDDTQALAAARLAGHDPAKDKTPPRKFAITKNASWALSQSLGGQEQVDELRSPINEAKAVKNATELAGMRACHVRDGAALTEYFSWLEHELTVAKSTLDEVQAADELERIRSKHEHFRGLSFDTISSTGANAAIIHYKPEPGRCATIDPNAVYLCDSGGQYLDGTTDTTRTLHFGTPTEMEREAFTLVLKGVIALETVVFPKGTKGVALDTLARQYLWQQGLDYRHGTGHGVGSYLNVHEGPIGIGTSAVCAEVALAPGNVVSDEPGYYEDGKFGIRIENIIICVEADPAPPHRFGGKPWLSFDHATMTPMCRRLIDPVRLAPKELEWLNKYHAEVREKTRGFFKKGRGDESAEESERRERALKWLLRETERIELAKSAA